VRDNGYWERPVRFGPGDRLFGILAGGIDRSSTAPSIILFNTGAGHHVGPHRLYVPLARQWAAGGHAVLRFDLEGIGDSGPASRQLLKSCGNAYPSGMLDDARHAIAFVRQAAPGRRVIVAGLCSGGWLAFQAARHGLEVDAIVAINPPLYLRDADQQWRAEGRELARYQQSMRNPSKWAKAVRGDASYATFTRLAARSLARKVTLRIRGALGEPPPDSLAGDLCTIAGRGITSFFVFSRGDDGLAYYNLHARPVLGRANLRDAVQHVVVEDAGHAFRPRAAQQLLRSLLTDFVTSRTRDSG
jgi:dienelactone hydrolase